MIVTIDGPAGSGKSTVARKLAARLEIAYMDTGAMYRAIAYAALEAGTDLADDAALTVLANTIRLEVDCGPTHTRVRVDGHDVSEVIRELRVAQATSYVARLAAVRELLVRRQREIGAQLESFVTEGRDQGSVVFPDADVRIVLEAQLSKRAQRRYREMIADGQQVDIEAVTENLKQRDDSDGPQWASLLQGGATVVDTTEMALPDVVDQLERLVRASEPRP